MSNELINRQELAKKMNVSTRHIINLEKEGLPVIRVGTLPRYNYMEVLRWLRDFKK